MERFAKGVNGEKPLIMFTKHSFLDISQNTHSFLEKIPFSNLKSRIVVKVVQLFSPTVLVNFVEICV